ncbi:protein DEPP [Hoplias malabaricus]|uniref:protein DEPP n=1 Tax=Hoplias malabaricus TaxID=27720 RepID=UPI00346318C4
MKPRRLLLSIAPLPTIAETHEDASQVGCQSGPSQSLEEYVNSIKELAQPACGPVRVARTLRPCMFSKPLSKHSSSSSPRSSSRTPRAPRSRPSSLGLDELTHRFSSQKVGSTDPLDWLFGQTQDELNRMDSASAALRLL